MKRSRSDGVRRRRGGRSGHVLALLLSCFALLVVPGAASAQDASVPAQECCLALLVPVSARSVALGRAIVARAGAEAAFANPAGLAGLDTAQVVVHHTTLVEGDEVNAVSLLFVPERVGTIGVSYYLLDHGEQDAVDGDGRPVGSLASRQHYFVASYATRVAAGFAAGIGYKLYQLRQDCSGFCNGSGNVATTHTVDFGVQYHPRWARSLQVGAAVTDLGFRLQVVNAAQADRPPTRLRVGAAYDALSTFRPDSALRLWVSGEVEYPVFGLSETVTGAGVELSVQDLVQLRAGYRSGGGLDSGPAVGVGVRYERFSVGVGKSFHQSPLGDSSPVQITFGVDF